jgi:molybdopterin molybdotransferase
MNAKTKFFMQMNNVFVALGIDPVPAMCKTLASIISISNELVDPSQSQIPEPVRNADNTLPILFMNKTETVQNFHEQILYGILPDKTLTLFPELNVATVECYLRIVSDEISKDGSDIITCVIAELDTIRVHNLLILPNKPTIIGTIGTTAVINPSHRPVNAHMITSLHAGSLLQTVSDDIFSPMMTSAQLSTDHLSEKKREKLVYIRIYPDEWKKPIIGKFGLLNTLAKNDGYVLVSTCLDGC